MGESGWDQSSSFMLGLGPVNVPVSGEGQARNWPMSLKLAGAVPSSLSSGSQFILSLSLQGQ